MLPSGSAPRALEMLIVSGLLFCAPLPLSAFQDSRSDVQEILRRLERIEEQNRALAAEVRALREQVAGGAVSAPAPATAAASSGEAAPTVATLDERVTVQESRLSELAQTKIGSDSRAPIRLTGMLLFNGFSNGRYGGGQDYPTVASPSRGFSNSGGSLRQTVLGFKFDGPEIAGGGKMSGSVHFDFFSGGNQPLNQIVRLRVATLDFNWKHTTISVGQDKPLISPREPTSIAQVGVSPLTGAGNLWLWQPQARIEQRFSLNSNTGVKAQLGVFQTAEGAGTLPADVRSSVPRARPGYEGRVEFWRQFGENQRIEIAPGFHTSTSHVAGVSVPSNIFSLDWLIRPFARLDFSGAFFSGANVGILGSNRPSISVFSPTDIRAVRSLGGWSQASFRATSRLSFNFFGGQQDDRNRDVLFGNIAKNQLYGANAIYRLGPNVLASFEASHVRTTYLGSNSFLNRHYDVALAYLF